LTAANNAILSLAYYAFDWLPLTNELNASDWLMIAVVEVKI
jgi:hypothetical protein